MYPEVFEDRVFINAQYKTDLSKSRNLRHVLELSEVIFDGLAELGLDTIYCHVDSHSSFNFNERLGFETTKETLRFPKNPELPTVEIMKMELV